MPFIGGMAMFPNVSLIAEADVGNLSFQGTRFKWFEPEKSKLAGEAPSQLTL